jgi:hypothetical protein
LLAYVPTFWADTAGASATCEAARSIAVMPPERRTSDERCG